MTLALDLHSDLSRLLGAVRDLSSARTLDDVMQTVRLAARELTGADGVSFVLRDGDHCYYAEENAIAPLWKGKRFPAASCVSGWAMLHRREVVIPDVFADPRVPADAYRPTFVKSLAMVPVRREDPIAAIGAYWAATHEATHRELGLLQTLADFTALALANVELLGSLERRAEESARLLERARADAAQRQRLEDQLRQAQKLEAVGRLAGGIAHDFNNLLMIMNGTIEVTCADLPPDSPLQQPLQDVLDAGRHATALTRQLLAFSRKQVLQPEVLDLNQVVQRMDALLRRVLGEDVRLVMRTAPDLARIEFDPSQFEQIVLNLVINARDAMPRGGLLTIETGNVELDEQYVAEHPGARSGPHVMFAVTDTGTGMDAETRERLFEPFFTTKPPGRGTGLGLATVHGIVAQSGGSIWVYSEPGLGTTFKVYLPSAGTDARPARRRAPAPADAAAERATILVVEDELRLRELLRVVLVRAGHTVLTASDPAGALEVCRQSPEPIRLLLCDLVLPGRSGRDLAESIRELQPGIRVVFMSGYTDDAVIHRGILEPGTPFIAKPIMPAELLERLRGWLAA